MPKSAEAHVFALKNLDYGCTEKQLQELHGSIAEVQKIGKQTAKVTLAPGSDSKSFVDEVDGSQLRGREVRVSLWEDHPRDEGRPGNKSDGRGRSYDRPDRPGYRPHPQGRSRSPSQGRGGPRGPRLVNVRGDHLVFRVPSANAFLEALSFEKDQEKGTLVSGIDQSLIKANYGFDPALLVLPSAEKGKKKAKISDARRVIHKRLIGVVDSRGTLWHRGKVSKEEAEKVLSVIQTANVDSRDLVLVRFSGDALLQCLAPIQLALAKMVDGEDIPWSVTQIQQITFQQQEVPIFTLKKWKSEEVEEDGSE